MSDGNDENIRKDIFKLFNIDIPKGTSLENNLKSVLNLVKDMIEDYNKDAEHKIRIKTPKYSINDFNKTTTMISDCPVNGELRSVSFIMSNVTLEEGKDLYEFKVFDNLNHNCYVSENKVLGSFMEYINLINVIKRNGINY